jgi:hypothetical protein
MMKVLNDPGRLLAKKGVTPLPIWNPLSPVVRCRPPLPSWSGRHPRLSAVFIAAVYALLLGVTGPYWSRRRVFGCVSGHFLVGASGQNWYFTEGVGRMWRKHGNGEDDVLVEAGMSLSVPPRR